MVSESVGKLGTYCVDSYEGAVTYCQSLITYGQQHGRFARRDCGVQVFASPFPHTAGGNDGFCWGF